VSHGLSEITTPQLVALENTTNIIKEAVKASADHYYIVSLLIKEKAIAIKKQHKSAMGTVSKLTDILN